MRALYAIIMAETLLHNEIKELFERKSPLSDPQITEQVLKLFEEAELQARSRTDYLYTPVVYTNYTGEKSFGELGPVNRYSMDYRILALRSWQAFTDNDIAKLIIDNYVKWVIGVGLRIEAQPNREVLRSEGVNLTDEQLSDFKKVIESRFDIHSNSKHSGYSKQMNLHQTAAEAVKIAALSGDCLIVKRFNPKTGLNVEVIDGLRIVTPVENNKIFNILKAKNHRIVNGIEMNERGEHIAYFVQRENEFSHERILAKGPKTGRPMAFMMYFSKYRIDYNRGVPILSPILENIQKIDRYKEASVGSAEERAKIVLQITHTEKSTGENPFIEKLRNSVALNNVGLNQDQSRDYQVSESTAQRIATTTDKEVYNMPVGSRLEAIEAKNELYFNEFFMTNLGIIAAACGIPPEVAKMTFNSNYTASRMATLSWDFSVSTYRHEVAVNGYYLPLYKEFLTDTVLRGKIDAPGFIDALRNKNHYVLESYCKAKFIGPRVPHTDPFKEVQAERLKLGPQGENAPLTTPERATEHLGGGDYEENKEKFKYQTEDFKQEIEPKEVIEVERNKNEKNK